MRSILSKVAHGVGKKYTQPITEYLYISLVEGELLIRSTNGVNFVTVFADDIQGDDGECVVKADQFIKLIDKTTKTETSFKLHEFYLEVKGNGTHKVAVTSDKFPDYEFSANAPHVDVNTDVLKRVFKVNESAIAKELILPFLTGYNVGATVITTDGIKMCINDTKITEERVLITQALADLISKTFTSDKVEVQKDGNKILIRSNDVTVFGTELDGLQDYPDITGVLGFEYVNVAKVNKVELLSILDRISLFIDGYDNTGLKMRFKENIIEIEDVRGKCQESMEYMDKTFTEEAELLLNVDFLKDILSAASTDVVEIKYDEQLPVRIDDGHVTLFLSTMNA
jgi:DNA polymerase III sliding clamp (beta) subunit (PCNA family)